MKKSQLLVASAMAAVFSMPLVLNAQSSPAPKPKFEPVVRSADGRTVSL